MFVPPPSDYVCQALRLAGTRSFACAGIMRVATTRDEPTLTVLRCTKCGRIASYGEEPAE